MPKTGPSEGSLSAATAFLPSLLIACERPIETVVFPSPAGVGLTAVTKTSFPSSLSLSASRVSFEILAL